MQRELISQRLSTEINRLQEEIGVLQERLMKKLNVSYTYAPEIRRNKQVLELRRRLSKLMAEARKIKDSFITPSRPDNTVERRALIYKKDPTRANLQAWYDQYWKDVRIPAVGLDRYAHNLYDEEYGKPEMIYVASLFVPKADPLGRMILCDSYSNATSIYGISAHLLAISGEKTPLVLAETHPDREKSPTGDYLRTHSMDPGGARISGLGFGVPSYLGTALAASLIGSKDGIFSWDGGAGRTSAGREFWQKLQKYGLAYTSDEGVEPEEEEYEEEQNVCVTLDERQRERLSERHESSRGDYGYPDSELCGDLNFYYTGREEGSGDGEREYVDVETAIRSPFTVFHTHGNAMEDDKPFPAGALFTGLRNNWDPRTNAPSGHTDTGGKYDALSEVYERFYEDDLPVIKDPNTQAFVANAVHGSSPFLVVMLAEALARSGAEALATTYLTRADVAPLIARNARALELLGQRRLPGLSGLPKSMHRSVMSAIAEAQAGVKIDWGAENPLRLQPWSAAQKKLLKLYEDAD